MVRGTRLPLQVCLSAAVTGLCGLLMAGSADAALLGPRSLPAGGGWPGARFGNGRANHNSFVIYSPSFSSDIQHIRNVNVGGNTLTPAAMCRNRVRHCKIIQNLNAFDP